MREIKYRFYDKRVKKMYYPNPQQLPFFINACMQDRYKNVIIPMQATGLAAATIPVPCCLFPVPLKKHKKER